MYNDELESVSLGGGQASEDIESEESENLNEELPQVDQEKSEAFLAKRKKIIKFATIALGALLAIGGVTAGAVLWCNAENQLKYEAVQDGYAIDSGLFYGGSVSGKFEIPSTYNGKPITEIRANAFKNFDNVTEVVIPYTVTKINNNAFAECDNLQKISFANKSGAITYESKLRSIGASAFYNCGKLSEFILPYGVTTIWSKAFYGTSISKLDIPETVSFIDESAFAYCHKLSTITVGGRDELPSGWSKDWNKNCAAVVEYSLRVKFDYNGATGNNINSEQYVIYDKPFSFPVPVKTGYTFEGWYESQRKLTDNGGTSLENWNFKTQTLITAHWTANENKIIFNANGGNGSMAEQKARTDEKVILAKNSLKRDGYTFAGWSTSQFGAADYLDEADFRMGTASAVTLYAVWSANLNEVRFDGNGATGGSTQSQSIKTDAVANLNENGFFRTGYDFIGWSSVKDGNAEFKNCAKYIMGVEKAYTLYAVWAVHKFTITYNLNGGTVIENFCEYDILTKTFTLNNPTRAGYTFVGWTGTDIDEVTQNVTVEEGGSGNRSYTANWNANINSITFHANGGEGEMPQQKLATDSFTALNKNSFIRIGYDFMGWATSPNGEKLYGDEEKYTMGVESNYNLYAVWILTNYKITYNLNGGAIIGNPYEYTIKTQTFTLKNPTRTGYTFAGWSGTEIEDKSSLVEINKGSIGNRQYNAIWETVNYSISYELNGGTVSENVEEYDIETQTFTLNNPEKVGYTFMGWTGTGIIQMQKTVEIVVGTYGNRIYEAHYKANEYVVTLNTNGGKCDKNQITVTYDENYVLPAAKKFGYDFLGWYNGNDLIESGLWQNTENLIFEAKWQKQEIIKITDAEELAMVAYMLDQNFILQNDIVLSDVEWEPLGDKVNPFTGTFDGNGRAVSGFKITKAADYVGFFGANEGTVKNIKISNATVTSGTIGAGILAGYNTGTIENCTVEGAIESKAESVGGLVGLIDKNVQITGCTSNSSVANKSAKFVCIGGIIGSIVDGNEGVVTVENSYMKGNIVASGYCNLTSVSCSVGGIIGFGYNVNIHNCYFDGAITSNVKAWFSNANGNAYSYVGGVVGRLDGLSEILNSYVVVDLNINVMPTGYLSSDFAHRIIHVYSNSYAGGIVGSGGNDSSIENCFGYVKSKDISVKVVNSPNSYGTVYGDTENKFGGIYGGTSTKISIKNSYRYSDDESNITVGTPTSLANFKSVSFIKNNLGWDDSIWILENGEFPKLKVTLWI